MLPISYRLIAATLYRVSGLVPWPFADIQQLDSGDDYVTEVEHQS